MIDELAARRAKPVVMRDPVIARAVDRAVRLLSKAPVEMTADDLKQLTKATLPLVLSQWAKAVGLVRFGEVLWWLTTAIAGETDDMPTRWAQRERN